MHGAAVMLEIRHPPPLIDRSSRSAGVAVDPEGCPVGEVSAAAAGDTAERRASEQVPVLGMPLDIGGDERALRDDLQPLVADQVERSPY